MRTSGGKGERQGIAFVLVLAFVLILAVGAMAFVALSGSEIWAVRLQADSTRAFYIAEGGAERGLAWLKAQPSPPEGTLEFDPFGGPQPLGGESYTGSYTVTIDPDDSNPTDPLKKYDIIATGSVGAAQRKIIVEVEVESFARYSYFTDDEHTEDGTPVWFITGDSLEGLVHTNTHFHLRGEPVFMGPATSGDNYMDYMRDGLIYTYPPDEATMENPDFQQGIRLGVEPIELPASTGELRDAAVSGGLLLGGDTTVSLLADGSIAVTNAEEGWVDQNVSLPPNGVFFVDGDLTISGTLSGQLTAVSNGRIIVVGDISYKTDPRIDPTSPDLLGLVAGDYVVVARDAPYDLEIDASIMAIGESFLVEQWWQGPAKGTLTIYGGLVQDLRGPVGTFNPETGMRVSGYAKDYHFDSRLLSMPPPYFPTTGDYVILSWRED